MCAPSMATRPRRSLVVGIDYVGTTHTLSGTLQDAASVRDLALGLGGQVRVLLSTAATAAAMTDGWRWLCADAGAQATFYFSGHGVADPALLSSDLVRVTRDVLHAALVLPALRAGVDLTIVLDCCHSGGMMTVDSGGEAALPGSLVCIAAAAASQDAGDGAQSAVYDARDSRWVMSTPHGTFTQALLNVVRLAASSRGACSNAAVFRAVCAELLREGVRLQTPVMTGATAALDRRFCLAKNLSPV